MSTYMKGSDFVLELGLKNEMDANLTWLVFTRGVTNTGESIEDNTTPYYYHDGKGSSETAVEGTSKSIAISGHRIHQDPVQEYLFRFKMVYNTVANIREIPYRWYNTFDGKGETGLLSVSYNSAAGGTPNERIPIDLVLSVQGLPNEYTKDDLECTVTYDANGGTGTITDSNKYVVGKSAVVSDAGDTEQTGKDFAGWNTKGDGSGYKYLPGDKIALGTDTALFAVWEV